MTNIFLLWRRTRRFDPDPHRVSERLSATFRPVLGDGVRARTRQTAFVSMVHMEALPRYWKPPLFEEDVEGWAVALDYPVSVAGESRQPALLPLCRELQSNPAPAIRRMAPPFSLVWSSTRTGETWVQNDGLGHAQLFEYSRGHSWAVTNRVFALGALNVPIEPVPEEWAARMTLGWFPLELTGYRGLHFCAGGTQLHVGREGVSRRRVDALADWLAPGGLTPSQCVELGRESLLTSVGQAATLWDKASLLFSGGRDSRAIAALLRAAGVPFLARAGGVPENPDVLIASRLARAGQLEFEVSPAARTPAPDPTECRRRISLALLWEAGFRLTAKHELFLPDGGTLGRGSVKISGKHGEIGRAYYAKAWSTREEAERQEQRFVDRRMHSMPPFTRRRWREPVRELIAQAYRRAEDYGLSGLARQDFFYLHERTRRLASGSHSAKAGFVFAPFMNPGFIRASFAYPAWEKVGAPFHQHIVGLHAPEWVGIPYTSDLDASDGDIPGGSAPLGASAAAGSWQTPNDGRDYDARRYWETVGRSLVDECFAHDGLWTDIYDPDKARQLWAAAPQKLVVPHLLTHVLDSPAMLPVAG